MKKLLAIIISAILVASMMTAATLAMTFDFGKVTDESPVVDGLIGDGEYTWSTGKLDKLISYDNEFYVKTPEDLWNLVQNHILLPCVDSGCKFKKSVP